MEMETKRSIIENNLLLKLRSGSHLYGLNTPQSDIDYLGVVLESFEYKVGFNTFFELDVSYHDKQENGKNTKDAIDEKYYSLTKFVDLLFKNNPTILELIFAKDVIYKDPIIDTLYENRHLFLDRDKIVNAFIGYAIAQERKMETKSENLSEVIKLHDLIKDIDTDGVETLIDALNHNESLYHIFNKYKDSQVDLSNELELSNDKQQKRAIRKKIGKIYFGSREYSVNILFKKFKAQIESVVKNKSSRSELIETHGYDTKFFHNVIRLIIEGIELLTTGEIVFPLKEHDLLMDCKMGKYSYDDAIELISEYKAKLRDIYEGNIYITSTTNKSKIESIIIDFYKQRYGITT